MFNYSDTGRHRPMSYDVVRSVNTAFGFLVSVCSLNLSTSPIPFNFRADIGIEWCAVSNTECLGKIFSHPVQVIDRVQNCHIRYFGGFVPCYRSVICATALPIQTST